LTTEEEILILALILVLIILQDIYREKYPNKPTTGISGTVTEPNGQPAAGAIVTLTPDNISSTADDNGNFSITSNTTDGSTGTLTAVDSVGNKAVASVLLDGNSHVVALVLASISFD
jgi:hypothetical protein